MTDSTSPAPTTEGGAAQHPEAPWWTSATVYQIWPRSFADGDGDGVGDLAGIRSKLGHLHDLGVDVLWLSPIYRSPQADAGYDISDYDDIDPLFGTLDEFDELLAEVHALGMKLVMDLVVNHTSDQHPWFAESRSSVDSPKRDWYVWRPRAADGSLPTEWRSFFSGPAWQLDPATDEHYLHMFAVGQPDLNWRNAEMRAAVHAMMNRWLDRGVDGFRMDVINFIAKTPASLEPGAAGFEMDPSVHDHLQEMHREVFAHRPDRQLITVGEMPGATVDDAVLFTDQQRHELDMVFQFEHVDLDHGPDSKFDVRPLRLSALKRSLARWQEGLADRGWNSLYLGNHDQPRLVSRFGDDGPYRVESATALAAVLHLHRGTPYVYQGDEIGMTNAGFTSIEQYRDVESLNWHEEALAAGASEADVLESLRSRSRDNARTPVQWSAGAAAGFTTGTPWIGVTANSAEVNVEADRASGERSVFEFTRRLIALRHELPVVQLGAFALLAPDDERLWAFTRTLGDERLLVLANCSGEPLDLDPALDPVLRRRSVPDLVIGNTPHGIGSLTLGPWEVRVLRG
ncbi:glycoside hydrolase family 13 protein [Frigoribacterium faeni]|uniref:glycoside hydrolase family 13 protein n=1 Tax=Frigoribacterium faeni TaxID=145483 RepID=UPI00141B9CB8|nr:alpha-glucosidase [Frigoribacterium faeni]NIJ06371.1 oligo-1,6-glucosidase [Frigoribacterium faeni]